MSERNRPALTPEEEPGPRSAHSALPAGERRGAPAGTQSRRALLAGAGAVGAAVVLSACGGNDSDSAAPGNPAGTGGTGSGNPAGTGTGSGNPAGTGTGTGNPAGSAAPGGDAAPGAGGIVGTAEIPEGGGRIIADAAVVITQPQPGEFKAFDFTCTHQRCPVSRIADGKILCTCHNSAFSISDGSPLSGPATRPLAAKEIIVEGGRISLA
ncbi:Rieske (2Fe-2S) protein [Melissospora conviva]|uniref:Rieske (2Fe-2S) protein n=1 Tax=Melissospora conviva TaxID=3388432 RepID=UPI003C1EE8F0